MSVNRSGEHSIGQSDPKSPTRVKTLIDEVIDPLTYKQTYDPMMILQVKLKRNLYLVQTRPQKLPQKPKPQPKLFLYLKETGNVFSV
jgi:hypothetical protein